MVARFCSWTIDIFVKVLKGSLCYNSILDFKYNEAIAFSNGRIRWSNPLIISTPFTYNGFSKINNIFFRTNMKPLVPDDLII